jgi:hypothetical protein
MCPSRKPRFSTFNETGLYVPEAVDTVVPGGASVDNFHRTFGSLRLRYFGPRPFVEDNSVRSKATTLLTLEGRYQATPNLRVNVEVFTSRIRASATSITISPRGFPANQLVVCTTSTCIRRYRARPA